MIMSKEKKQVRVKFDNDNLRKAYEELSETDSLKKRIDFVIERIKQDPVFGQPISAPKGVPFY